MENQTQGQTRALDRYLSPLDVWAMAFGCMVGWGVFAMPGTTFLPVAGPAGTLIAFAIGTVIMLVIGGNFSYLMGRSSITSGVYSYTMEAFGRDHAFLSSWFLCLSYLTIVFLNGTALFFVVRTLFDGTLQNGVHYTLAGNDIYLGVTFVGLTVMLYVQNVVRKKHEAVEREKIHAVESSLARSQFLFNMSHDIRTPMNAIIGYTNLALNEDDPAAVRDFLEKIDASSQHLLALINDILEMSRIESGRIAVDMVAAAEPGHYDAVLMDIQMPVMNGYEATRAIRGMADKRRASLPILAMTANAFKEDERAAEEAGMQAHIAKPIDVGSMMQTLTAVLQDAEKEGA